MSFLVYWSQIGGYTPNQTDPMRNQTTPMRTGSFYVSFVFFLTCCTQTDEISNNFIFLIAIAIKT